VCSGSVIIDVVRFCWGRQSSMIGGQSMVIHVDEILDFFSHIENKKAIIYKYFLWDIEYARFSFLTFVPTLACQSSPH